MQNGRAHADESRAALTFVIPVWDRYVELLDNLCHHLKQEIAGARLVIVDNASSVQLPQVEATIIRLSTRRSTGAARNAGLPYVTTDFVCFFDADDLPVRGALQKLLNVAGDRSDVVAVTGTGVAWHPAAGATIDIPFSDRELRLQRHRRMFGLASVVRNRYATVNSILRTSAVVDAGGFSDLNYCEDWGLSTSLAFRGRIYLAQQPTFLSRIHVGSMIHLGGTPGGIIQALPPLYWRWLRDKAIPVWLKPLFVLTPIPRLKRAYVRRRRHMRSHDDLFAILGRHGLLGGEKESTGS